MGSEMCIRDRAKDVSKTLGTSLQVLACDSPVTDGPSNTQLIISVVFDLGVAYVHEAVSCPYSYGQPKTVVVAWLKLCPTLPQTATVEGLDTWTMQTSRDGWPASLVSGLVDHVYQLVLKARNTEHVCSRQGVEHSFLFALDFQTSRTVIERGSDALSTDSVTHLRKLVLWDNQTPPGCSAYSWSTSGAVDNWLPDRVYVRDGAGYPMDWTTEGEFTVTSKACAVYSMVGLPSPAQPTAVDQSLVTTRRVYQSCGAWFIVKSKSLLTTEPSTDRYGSDACRRQLHQEWESYLTTEEHRKPDWKEAAPSAR